MIVQCPSCASRYRVNDANIPPTGGKIRCPSCQHAFVVYPEAAADFEDDADKTSVADRPNLREVLKHMQGQGGNDEVARTEVMSGSELPDYGSMFGSDAGGDEDGEDRTVEMANPLNVINDLFRQDKSAPVEDDINTAEINADLIQKSIAKVRAQSGSIVGEKPPEKPPVPSPTTVPQPPPPKYGPPAGPPALPPRAAGGPPALPGQSGQFGARPGDLSDSSSGRSTPFQESKSSPDAFSNPPNLRGESTSSPSSPAVPSFGGEPLGSFGAPAAPAAPAAQAEPTADPEHQGPWKLQTNFGLTYEFPDTKGLKSWLSNRDELDGYTLSADGENFFPLEAFPQLRAAPASARRSGNFSSHPPGLGGLESPLGNPVQSPSGGFSPSSSGLNLSPFQTASGQPQYPERAPLPAPSAVATGPKINTENYRPPSREAKWNGVMWGVAAMLFVVAGAMLVQVLGWYDLKELILGTEAPAPIVQKHNDVPPPDDEVVVDTAEVEAERLRRQREQVDRILEDAEMDMSSNRLTSALERLNTARTLEPGRVRIYEMLAEINEKLGQTEEAETLRETAQELREQRDAPPPPDEQEDEG
ncbi:MAG: zinc-ribbon domain-containing protein [Bradymonadaceae bacterium]